MKKLSSLFFLTCFLLLAAVGFSATIVTKSGQTYEGEIVRRDDDSISIIVNIDSDDIASIDDDTGYACPVKKVPAREGNFEIIQGTVIPAPIDTVALKRAIYKALADHGYRILSDEPGVITYKLERDDYDCTVRFCYCPHEYWYEYVDSTNLDARPEKNKIHRSYRRWIGILEEDISDLYW